MIAKSRPEIDTELKPGELVSQPQGDWFVVKTCEDRFWIGRVMCFAYVAEHGYLIPIDTQGGQDHPESDPSIERYFVRGEDKSPSGQTWLDVYQSVTPTIQDVREITHVIGEDALSVPSVNR